MNILVACEESQTVTKAFRKKGHNAFSCDIQDCSGGYPQWHIKTDVIRLLNGSCEFTTVSGKNYKINDKWDMIIAFPPCTYLTFAGNQMFSKKLRTSEEINYRKKLRKEAIDFFMKFVQADCNKIAIENPLGCMSTFYRQPDQIIHPYYFCSNLFEEDYQMKRTCLWLRGLPLLTYDKPLIKPYPINIKPSGKNLYFTENCVAKTNEERRKKRSKTFNSIANAMAQQWGNDVKYYYLLS